MNMTGQWVDRKPSFPLSVKLVTIYEAVLCSVGRSEACDGFSHTNTYTHTHSLSHTHTVSLTHKHTHTLSPSRQGCGEEAAQMLEAIFEGLGSTSNTKLRESPPTPKPSITKTDSQPPTPKPHIPNPKPQTPNSKPQTPNPIPETLNHQPCTLNHTSQALRPTP